MHPRRRNGYRMSYRNPVAADPARAPTMEIPGARELAASGSVNLILKHEKNNVTAAQVSASPCFVKLHEQCYKMCVNMKMNGLSKSGSHSTGHHNQSDGLVRSEKP